MSVTPRRRPLRRRIRKFFSKRLAALLAQVGPVVYVFYMNLVWRTSRVEMIGIDRMLDVRVRHGGFVAALWHEGVFFVAYAFREFEVSTLASISDMGTLITNMLERCGFVVFRGGSSKGNKSRKTRPLPDMIEHMRTSERVIFGLTVDGSHGPARRLKPGAVLLSRASGAPVLPTHIACRPALRAPTWDRTRIPLPFSRILILVEGPIFHPTDLDGDALRRAVAATEEALHETTRRAERLLAEGGRLPATDDDHPPLTRRFGPRFMRPGEPVHGPVGRP